MNSGIQMIEEDDGYYLFTGYSGSVYKCYKGAEEMRMSISGIWLQLKGKYPDNVELVKATDIVL
jgi:hypothetical protein